MISIWLIIPVFIVAYFLGKRRGEFIGTEAGWVQAKIALDKALQDYKLEQLKGEK